uniref:Cytochrome c oxidase assembly factor 5 n=2 Tax=Physcomitrium patens TaxID=3218 RepID=A0A7I4EYZ6_PHYPA
MADDGSPQVHKSCRALALSLVKCLDESACIKENKRSYKDCALDKNLTASSTCKDIRDNYMKCKHEQVGIVVRERLLNNPELFRFV